MKAGIIIESLDESQKAIEITREMNKLDNLEEYCDVIAFYINYGNMFLSPKFAMMNILEVYGFDGPVISTSIETTKILINSIRPPKKFFYLWDLEWTYKIYNVEELLDVYMNLDIELIVRSEEHSHVVEQCWKKPIAVIENFNYEEITKLIA